MSVSADIDAASSSRSGVFGPGVAKMFRDGWGRPESRARRESLPEVLVGAAADVLGCVGVRGAGVTVFAEQVRLPLAASSVTRDDMTG